MSSGVELLSPSAQVSNKISIDGRSNSSSLFTLCDPNHGISQKQSSNPLFLQKRFKKKKKGKGRQQESDSESESEKEDDEDFDDEDDGEPRDYQLVDISAPSLRLDAVLKNALPYSRKQIEDAFYDARLRVNNQVPSKKAENVAVDDIIDYIKGLVPDNPDLLEIQRVQIVEIPDTFVHGRAKIKIKRWRSLRIQNYPDGTKYEGVLIARSEDKKFVNKDDWTN